MACTQTSTRTGRQVPRAFDISSLGHGCIFPAMARSAVLLAVAVLAAACIGDAGSPETSLAPTTSSTSRSSTTSTLAPTTSSGPTSTLPPVVELPVDGPCAIDVVPDGGEATVLVDGRLYGLGPDGASPRCLVEGIESPDLLWGPLGDRLLAGNVAMTAEDRLTIEGAESLGWSGPTGTRVIAVSPDRLWKTSLDDSLETDITFLSENSEFAYHPAGEHLLQIGMSGEGQYGLWLASNEGTDPSLLAFDEEATMTEPGWSWLNEPLFIAKHLAGDWHIHRVELTPDGGLEGPVVVETQTPIDRLMPSPHDPVMLAFRLGASSDDLCSTDATAAVNGVDLPAPLDELTSSPIGWLSVERLLVMAFPEGCDSPTDLWVFSAGFCPGSVYGAEMLFRGVDGAAAREAYPPPPPPPDFTGIIDPAPA